MKVIKVFAMTAAAVLVFLTVGRLTQPKYMSAVREGALTSEYYKSEKDHQVVFIGDCEVYENFSPITLWREHGITSYIRGGAQQLIWHSYYTLEDTLYYEKPDVVVFNVLSMKYAEPQSEAYNRLNLENLRFSPTKISAVNDSIMEDEDFLSYFLPVLRYHDRWKEINADDFKYFFGPENVSHNGFMMRSDIRPVDVVPVALRLADYSIEEICWDYLDKMRELCEKNGIKFVLVKAPSISPHWYSEWDAQVVEYADKYGLLYVNLLDRAEEAGIDFDTDTYDAGLHLNVYGAEKLSVYFGDILKDNFNLSDLRTDEKTASLWEEKGRLYDEMKTAQEQELVELGKIETFTY